MHQEKVYCENCKGRRDYWNDEKCKIKEPYTGLLLFDNYSSDSYKKVLNKDGNCKHYEPLNSVKFWAFIKSCGLFKSIKNYNLFKKGDKNGVDQSSASGSKVTDRAN